MAALITDPTWIFSVVLAIILLAPLLLRRLNIPPLIGLILAGILIGQNGLNLLAHDSSFSLFGQVGIYYIMFLAGLELEMGSVEKHGRRGLYFGILTFGIPFALGIWSSTCLLGYSLPTSILLACIYASHTLVTYPIVGRYGLNRHPVAVVSIVATAFALLAALVMLAVVVGGTNPDTNWLTWLLFGLRCCLYVAFVVFTFPRIGRWFLRRYEDSVLQYIFILTLVFLSASLAKFVGLEGLLGAFFAGLIVNRLIPKTSPLMSRLEFVGNALFIPYFLIGVGMIIDLTLLVRHPETLWVVAVMVVTGAIGKLIPAGIMTWWMGENRNGMWLMFGLTNAHAAGALAIVTIGTNPDVNLMSDEVLGGTVMLILFSCIISGFATTRGAKQLAMSDMSLEDNRGSYHGKCLITYSQEDNVDVMTQLAILIRNPFIPDSLMGLAVAYDGGNQDGVDSHRKGRQLLEKAQLIAAAADVPMATLNRLSTNIAGGILHTMSEYDCGEVIMCLTDRTTGMAKSSLGTIIDGVVSGSHREVMAVRNIVPPGTIRRVVVAVPQKAEYEVGFYKWIEHICRIGEELDCHLEYNAHPDTLPYIRGYMEQKHGHVRAEYHEMSRWMQFLNLRHDMGLNCMLVAVTARPGFISYQNRFEDLPLLLHRYFSETNVMLLFPDQWGDPQGGLSVFTPNGTAVTHRSRSLGAWLRRKIFGVSQTATMLLLFFPLLCMAQRPRYEKLSPMVRKAVMQEQVEHRHPARRSRALHSPHMLTLIQTDSEEVLASHGCRSLAHWGNIHAVDVARSALAALSSRPEIQRIECGRMCQAQTDTAGVITHSDILRTGTVFPTSYTGRGVVVGVMDIGFDLTHPTFLTPDLSRCRIGAFWDMLDGLMPSSSASDSHLQEPVEEGRDVPFGRTYETPERIREKACSTDSHLQYHGTHTASTAAGCGFGSPYIGMAPDAEICLVNNAVTNDMELVPDSMQEMFGATADLLGFEYIFRYADRVGKPCVINFSEGSHEDLWGESRLYYAVLDSLVRPGRIICASAGNQSIYGTYMNKPKGRDRSGALILTASNTTYMMLRSRGDFRVRLDFMASPEEPLLTYEVDIADVLATQDSLLVDTVQAGRHTFQLIYGSYPCCYDDTELVTDVVITKLTSKSLGMEIGLSVSGEDADVQVYQQMGYLQAKDGYPQFTDAEHTHNIHYPGSAPSVICVGATSWRTGYWTWDGTWHKDYWGQDGEVATYSSRGPTLAGLIKPDVLAPGTNVVAAFNSYFAEKNPDSYILDYNISRFQYGGREYAWCNEKGTSMSSPVVAGIIAQWMEYLPTLTREQAMAAIAASSRHPDPGRTYPNCDYGYGEIDAEAGLRYLMSHYDSIGELPASRPDADAVLYNLQGQRVAPNYRGLIIQNGRKVLRR